MRPRSPLTVVALGMIIYAGWFYSKELLLALCGGYVLSGILVRTVGSIRRHVFPRRGIEQYGGDAGTK